MIKLENIFKTYQDKTKNKFRVKALIDISFEVECGSFVAVLGPSGSGKTTLMNLIGGLDKPDSGTIRYDNKCITKFSLSELADFRNKNVGFIFQHNYLEPQFTVLKNVCVPLIIAGVEKSVRESKSRKLLNELGLNKEADRLACKLSGGQMKRACIARALINDPDIILADEPTGSLDNELSEMVIKMLRDISSKGVTVFMVTHSKEAAKKADRILYLEKGHLDK